jgi:hypothetical protein
VTSLDSYKSRKTLKVGSKTYQFYSLKAAEEQGLKGASRLPFSLKVLLENLIRHEDGRTVSKADLKATVDWLNKRKSDREIAFRPARVLMQDFTGVPAVVDLAAMRDAMKMLGGDPNRINPLVPVDLVIDHSVIVDFFGAAERRNIAIGFKEMVTKRDRGIDIPRTAGIAEVRPGPERVVVERAASIVPICVAVAVASCDAEDGLGVNFPVNACLAAEDAAVETGSRAVAVKLQQRAVELAEEGIGTTRFFFIAEFIFDACLSCFDLRDRRGKHGRIIARHDKGARLGHRGTSDLLPVCDAAAPR